MADPRIVVKIKIAWWLKPALTVFGLYWVVIKRKTHHDITDEVVQRLLRNPILKRAIKFMVVRGIHVGR
jgi:hypothetical protein